jgi:hypothetical protein
VWLSAGYPYLASSSGCGQRNRTVKIVPARAKKKVTSTKIAREVGLLFYSPYFVSAVFLA